MAEDLQITEGSKEEKYQSLIPQIKGLVDEKDTIVPKALHQWKFIPEEWTVPAAKRDGRLLFNRE